MVRLVPTGEGLDHSQGPRPSITRDDRHQRLLLLSTMSVSWVSWVSWVLWILWILWILWLLVVGAVLSFQWTFSVHGDSSLALGDPKLALSANQLALFSARVDMGRRRPQLVEVALDFRLSVLWVLGSEAQCAVAGNNDNDDQFLLQLSSAPRPDASLNHQWGKCDPTNVFNPQKLPLYRANESDFAATYTLLAWGTQTVSGGYGIDSWGVATPSNNVLVLDFIFGVANRLDIGQGRLGIGLLLIPETSSSSSLSSSPPSPPDFLSRLKQQGAIKKRLYSVFRSAIDSEVRSILFGAVDTKKFQGNLTTLPMIMTDTTASYGTPTQFQVTLQRLDITTLRKDPYPVTSHKYPAIFDLGQRNLWLPRSLHDSLLDVINLKNRTQLTVPCEVDGTIRIKFTFGGNAELDMPLNDLIRPLAASGSQCQLAILPHDNPVVILGDNVLRHAYVVYDHERYEISLAPIMYTPQTNVVEVSDDDDLPLPGALMASNYAEVGQIYTVLLALEAKPPRTIGNLMNGARGLLSSWWLSSVAAVVMMML